MPQNPFDELLVDQTTHEPAARNQPTNPFDQVVAAPDADQERKMRAARMDAQTTTPDKRAESMRLSSETGLPVDVIERNFDAINQRLAVDRHPYSKVQAEAPALAQWSTDPNNAAVAHDDMEQLGALEWVLKAPGMAFAQQLNQLRYAELRTKSMFRPLSREEQDAMGAYKFHADQGGQLGVGDSFFAKAITGAGRLLAQAIEPAKYAVVGGLETAAVGAVGGSVVPGVGTTAGAVGGFTIGARAGAMYGVFKSTAMQEAAGTYDELLAMKDETGHPIDPAVARIAALTVGGLNGMIEQVGLEAFLKRFPGLDKISKGMGRDAMKTAFQNPTVRAGFARLAKQYAGGMSVEVATEVAQRGITIAGEELAKVAAGEGFAKQRRTAVNVWDELVLEAASAVPEFALGMLPGPTLSFAQDVAKAKQAEQGVAFFTALNEGTAASKTAQRMPAAFEQLVEAATKDGPVKEVYAPTETWKTYWQGQDIDPAAMAAEVTGRPGAMDLAERTGNLVIPTARYAATLAGTEHAAFFTNELRLGNPDAFNGREMLEFRDQVEQTQQRIADQVKAERETAAAKGLEDSITAQLVEANVPRGSARTTAQALSGVATMAERAGFDPATIFEPYGLRVERRTAAEAPSTAAGAVIGQEAAPGQEEEVAGLGALEAGLKGISIETLDPATGGVVNGSGESAASAEALSRQATMQGKGEQFVVYDRAGRRRLLLGPDAVDYTPHKGETYGVESPEGFRLLTDNGGRVPTRDISASPLGASLGRLFGQQAALPAVRTGQKVNGERGATNEKGERAYFVGYQEGFGDIPTMALYNIEGGERDGTTTDADDLRAMGIEIPPTPPLLEFNQRAIATTPALRAWFGNSAVVDEEGQPLVVYHGTTKVFSTFDQERGNPESDFGRGFYFSNNVEDVGLNYAGVGPDLKQKIDMRAEQLAQEQDLEYNDPAIIAQATAEHVEHEGLTIPVFLKMENPAVVGGPNETLLTYELVEDPETGDFIDEKGTLTAFVLALRDEAALYHDGDVEGAIGKVMEHALDGGIPLSKVVEILKGDEQFQYFTDDNGTLVANEIVRGALESTGFDGIIDHTVDVKFGSQRRLGKAMAGMDEDTVHYVAFQPTQIKSALFNRGTFDPVDPNILFQSALEGTPASNAFFSRLDVAVRESKLAKASGAQWKATIRNARVGVNKDEFAITRVEDLEDDVTYTKEEVLAYFKANRPKVGMVTLEGNELDEETVRERADEIFDRMAEEAENDVDWDDYVGTATTLEDTETREVEQLDLSGDPLLDEDGDPIVEEEEVTVYYPAIEGGYVKRARGYGLGRRRGTDMIEGADSYEDEDDALKAAERYVRDIGREPFYEMVSDSVREGLDYGEAEREAREELEGEAGGENGRYAEYVLEPEAEEGSYREVFITAAGMQRAPAPGAKIVDREAKSQERYQKPYTELTFGQRAQIDSDVRASEIAAEGGAYEWHDGHDLYEDIENPIVRIRLNVRRTVSVRPAREVDQAVMQRGIEATAERDALIAKYGATGANHLQALVGDDDIAKLDAANKAINLAGDEMQATRARTVQGERVLFIEEVQPPRPEEQPKMPPIFVKNWREIAFKWALREAANEGLHAVAWTTGAQQADRYNLRKTVHKVTSVDVLEGAPMYEAGARKVVHVDLIGSPMLVLQVAEDGVVFGVVNDYANRWDTLIGQPLAAVLGDELAASVMQPGEQKVEGKGLLVGGEGLKKLYDYDFRNVVNALPAVKKNGGRVATVTIESKPDYEIIGAEDVSDAELAEQGRARNDNAKHYVRSGGKIVAETSTKDNAFQWITDHRIVPTEQPALILTPELNTAVMGGQALFQHERYRPATSSEIETLNQQLDAVVQAALADAPSGTGFDAHVTNQGELYIDSIMVPAEAQGQGAGTKVMRAVTSWADEHNMQVALDQAPNRGKKTALRRFYSRFGFVKNGTARFYDASSAGDWVRPAKDDVRQRRRMMQAAPAGPRGSIQFSPSRTVTISLFENADLSTFLHETGHFYLEVMGDLVDRLDMLDVETLTPQQHQLRTDYATILAHLGVTSRSEIEREHHELFARSFEAYLMEGKAPSLRLREAFGRFRAWMLGVYRSLKALNAPLTDDVRKVFDRMLATDEAIAAAESAGRIEPMFLTPEAAGMSHERFALYRSAIEEASRSSRETLDRKLLEEVRREQTDQWKTRKAEVKAQVTTNAHGLPVYNAITAMQRGTKADGSPLVEGETPAPIKLSKAMLVAQFGHERLAGIPKTLYSREGGVDAGVVAEMFGFSSGDEMLSAIAGAMPMRQFITAETDKRMLLEHGSLLLDGTLQEQAQAAVADEHREIVLREELRALAKQQRAVSPFERETRKSSDAERTYERRWFEAETKLRIAIAEGHQQVEIDKLEEQVRNLKRLARIGPSRVRGALPSMTALRDAARASVAATTIRDLNPASYWSAARRASQAATEAAARQDFEGAITAKHQELISLALYRETVNAKEDARQRVAVAQATGKPSSMAKLRLAGETYHDQVAGVLDRFEFAPVPKAALDRRAALWKWVKGQEAQGIAIDLPDELLDEAKRVNYQELTVAELVGVTDGLKQLVYLARFKNRLLKGNQRRQLKAVTTKIAESIREHKSKRQETVRDRSQGTERNRMVQGVLAAHRKIASLVREMDGFTDAGPLWQAIIRPLNEAGSREAQMNADATKSFATIIERAYPKSQKRRLYARTFVPAVGKSMSKMERLMVALNWGNEGNRDRIMRAEGWTQEQAQAVLDTLDERDARFVQDVFDFIGSYWDQIAAKQERIYGLRPERVEASPFRIVGTELRGGYFPLKYDDRLSATAAGQLDLEAANLAKQAAFTQATTRRGHTKARAETLDLPVRLDFGVMFEHVAQVIHDLSHHEALIDIGRVLGSKDVQTAIYETHGDIAYKTLKNTVRDVAFGDLPAVNAFEKALNHTRTGATVVGLGWSLTTAIMQPLGLANSIVRIGPKAVGRGVARLLGSPARMNATVGWIYEKSLFMKTRGLTQQRELNEIRNQVGVYSGNLSGWIDEAISKTTFNQVTRQGIADSYFWLIQTMQKTVDVPTWLGAYDQAMTAGHEEETAIALADQAVLDSQGGGQVKDLAGVQRGGPAMKLFTNFYSYFSVVYNQAVESGKRAASKRDASSVGRLASDYLMLFIVPATLGYFIRQGLKPGDDDEPLAEALVRENLAYLMGSMVGLRELSGAVQGYYGYEGPAGARAFASASKTVKQISQGELDEALLRSLNETAGLLIHYPAAQVWRTTSGIAAIAEGKTENPLALVMGPEK